MNKIIITTLLIAGIIIVLINESANVEQSCIGQTVFQTEQVEKEGYIYTYQAEYIYRPDTVGKFLSLFMYRKNVFADKHLVSKPLIHVDLAETEEDE